MGVTVDNLKTSGKTTGLMEELTTEVIIGQISGRQHFKSVVGIGSTLQVFGGHLCMIC